MIKDNHIAAAGSIAGAVNSVRQSLGHTVKIEVEVDNLAQLKELLNLPVDIVLLDNMSLKDMEDAVRLNEGRFVLEASGNVDMARVREIAETGVNVISSGALTHSVKNIDFGLDWV